MEEFTAKTDFEGIKTEIFDKETTGAKETTGGPTNIDGLVTEQGFHGTGDHCVRTVTKISNTIPKVCRSRR